jgi:indole-3-glycerol phosphate synthase
VLGSLIRSTEDRVRELAPDAEQLEAAARAAPVPGSLETALRDAPDVRVIAEVKRRSPSKGGIAPGLSAAAQADAYAAGGAAAISVLTEPTEFGGSLADLDAARPASRPLLRKDFIVDRLQLLEARAHGASAVLLIARALHPDKLAELHAAARALSLDTLVEIHDERELETALGGNYPIVGVNNRNLETLEMSARPAETLLPQIPRAVVAVFESGVQSTADVIRAATLGADAVLVGSAVSASADPAAAVRSLTGVPRQPRRAN